MKAAAALPDRVGAGASFQGGFLVTDQADSPHLLAPRIKARLYFAIASDDNQRGSRRRLTSMNALRPRTPWSSGGAHMTSIRVLMATALAAPMSLAAQQSAGAPAQPTTNPMTMSYRAFAAHYGGWLVAAFDSIPADKYGYKPTYAQQTVGYIAQHLEDANRELCALFGEVKAPLSARDSVADTVKARWPKDTLVARLKASLEFCDTAMARLDDAMLADPLPAGRPGSGRTILRTRYLLAFVTDLAEHYSQVASYMRLMGMIPPSALPRPSR
jgi:DinB superfamily